ncbi:MAG: hypothetical protein MRERC_2c040 [Mycoplasmataceae bacterium RC_NB112A]|nr:MAG: hypothetical protein MRERC_2c040 [Mycoplasmataceae bacterium RC_NB112A]
MLFIYIKKVIWKNLLLLKLIIEVVKSVGRASQLQ